MILLAEQSIQIARSIESVFAFAANLENFSQWFPEVADVRTLDNRDYTEPGVEYIETVHMPLGPPRKVRIRVRECEVDNHLITEGNLMPILPRMEMYFLDRGEYTEVQWRMFARGRGFLFQRILAPIARATMQKRSRKGLQRLKEILEE